MADQFILIGIDDTDLPGTRGTGRLARSLVDHLEAKGAGSVSGVTRHQLLLHPDISFTSHNSAACIGLDSVKDPVTVFEICRTFLETQMILGSDPGLCVAAGPRISSEVMAFGKKAQICVLNREQAKEAAGRAGFLTETLGRAGQGLIGATAAAGLRGSGSDGRFIDLRGIRKSSGVLSVSEIKENTDIVRVCDSRSVELAGDRLVDSQDWLRPRLMDHNAVLLVEPHPTLPRGWISVDRRNSRHLTN